MPLYSPPHPEVHLKLAALDLPVVGKRTLQLRIVLEKPERSPLETLWVTPEDCQLRYYFADTGRPLKHIPSVALGRTDIEANRNNVDWTRHPWFRSCERCCRKDG